MLLGPPASLPSGTGGTDRGLRTRCRRTLGPDQVVENGRLRSLRIANRATEPDHLFDRLLPFVASEVLGPRPVERVTERAIFLKGLLSLVYRFASTCGDECDEEHK